MSSGGLAHWDDVKPFAGDSATSAGRGAISAAPPARFGSASSGSRSRPGSGRRPCTRRAPRKRSSTCSGAPVSWQDGAVYEIAEGDCIVHLPRKAHTLRAGSDGLDVLAFGTRVPVELGYLPRAGVGWLSPRWVEVDKEPGPWQREVELGEPECRAQPPAGEHRQFHRRADQVRRPDARPRFGGRSQATGSISSSCRPVAQALLRMRIRPTRRSSSCSRARARSGVDADPAPGRERRRVGAPRAPARLRRRAALPRRASRTRFARATPG